MNKIFAWLIYWISLPVWILISLWRNKVLRNILLTIGIISWYIINNFGLEAYVGLAGFVTMQVSLMARMIFLYAMLFWFISQTKVIESYPGEGGAISFDDYFGSDYLVELVRDWVSLLTDRTKLDAMGGRAVSGILLEGPPGVGKTMLAQALATDSDAAFIGMSGSDFTSMFFGVGVLKVRNMFSKARKRAQEYGACILFIDEVDAIALSRGGVSGDSNSPTQGIFGSLGAMGILSRLLVEMDGITEVHLRTRIQNRMRNWLGIPSIDPGIVLIMGSTNRKQVLDSAITRPGRFDRTISVTLPDKGSRRALFEGYLKKVKHEEDIDISLLVRVTPGVSQAFIASAVQKDAARLAIFDGRDSVSQQDILQSLQELRTGVPQPISEFEPEQRRQVSVHEAGHAVAAYHLMKDYAHIGWASIVRRGGILGYVSFLEKEDRYAIPLSRLRNGIIVALAGHEAVKLAMGEPWTGASGDLNRVRQLIAMLIAHLEFGTLPTEFDVFKAVPQKQIDAYMKKNIEATQKFLKEHRKELDALTEALLEYDELHGDEVVRVIEESIDA